MQIHVRTDSAKEIATNRPGFLGCCVYLGDRVRARV